MNKVTKVNCEGEDYGFVAGNALKGVSGASASEYIKAVVLPEGADLVEGCLLLVTFVNGNTAGFYGTKTIYSSNGTTFYYDQAMTDPVTLPPEDCYIITPVAGNEYLYQAFPVLSVNGVKAPFCDSKGHPFGGAAWNAGDEVTMLYMGDKFVAILATISQVVAGVDIPPTSDAVYNAIADEANSRDDAIAANNTAKGLVSSKTDNAIARWDGTAGKLQNSGVTINDSNVISGGTLNNASNVALALSNGVTCSTAAGTAAKTVSLTGFVLRKGAKLLVNVVNTNTATGPLTLNVNGTGAKTIREGGKVTSATHHTLTAGWYNCYYDGTYWSMDNAYEVYNARISNQADYTRGTALCATPGATAAKVAAMLGYTLRAGNCFPITFLSNNTANSMTLNVNSTGAKPVYLNGQAVSSSNKTLNSGTYLCLYDGSVYHIGFSGASTEGAYGGLLKADKWSMGTSSGYIKFSNGLIIQWMMVAATSTIFQTPNFPLAFSDRTSYSVAIGQGVEDCETRTTKDDDSGYDYSVGIDRKYSNYLFLSTPKTRKLFLVMFGY